MRRTLVCLLCALALALPLASCAREAPPEPNTLAGLLSGLRADEIGGLGGGFVTPEELAPLLNGAVQHPVEHAPLTLDGSGTDIVWSVSFCLGGGEGPWDGDDGVYLYAGLEENLVEVSAGANLPQDRLHLADEALYRCVRAVNDTPDGPIDQDAYAQLGDLVETHLDALLDGAWDGGYRAYELTGFYREDDWKDYHPALAGEDSLHAYRVVSVFTSDPPEAAVHMLAGGMSVDSRLRAHGLDVYSALVVERRDGVLSPVGFAPWYLLYESPGRFDSPDALYDAVRALSINRDG